MSVKTLNKKRLAPLVMPKDSPRAHGLSHLQDWLAAGNQKWRDVYSGLDYIARHYGFKNIDTPLCDHSACFPQLSRRASFGLEPVPAEVFGEEAALRAGVLGPMLRAWQEGRLPQDQTYKWLASGQVVGRRAGSLVHDQEFAFELLGSYSPLQEAQLLSAVMEWCRALGIPALVIDINYVGQGAAASNYHEALAEHLRQRRADLCDECVLLPAHELFDVLRCSEAVCQQVASEGPVSFEYLDETARSRLTALLESLEELGVSYQLSHHFLSPFGKQGMHIALRGGESGALLASGGDHLELAAKLTGKSLPAFGLTGSMTKLMEYMPAENPDAVLLPSKAEVYLVPLGDLAARRSLRLFRDLVSSGVFVHDHFGHIGVKNQLKAAQESGSPIALIMGQKEAMDEVVILRDVKSGMQEVLPYDKIVEEVKKRLGK